jgi:FkbM family methyltransferase
LHAALFGWPCDALTPIDEYLGCHDIREVALRMLDGDRFRWDIRHHIGLLPHDRWVLAESDGLRIWVNLFDGFVSYGVLNGTWELAERRFMLSCLRPGDCVVDAGANIGLYTLDAARAVGPAGHVYAFEPVATTALMLRRSVTENGFAERVTVHEAALGASPGWGHLVPPQERTNLGAISVERGRDGAENPIAIRPLDSIGISGPVRFLKIDVEGDEDSVLAGAVATIGASRPIILSEIFSGDRAIAFASSLQNLGYGLFWLGDDGLTPLTDEGIADLAKISSPTNIVGRPS